MNMTRKINIPTAILFILAAYGFYQVAIRAPFWFSTIPACEVHDARVAISPGMRYEARISVVKCDDGKTPTLELSIRDKTEPNKWESVDLGFPSTTDFDLTWLSENRLQVYYPPSFQIVNEPYELSGVRIAVVRKRPVGDPRGEGLDAPQP